MFSGLLEVVIGFYQPFSTHRLYSVQLNRLTTVDATEKKIKSIIYAIRTQKIWTCPMLSLSKIKNLGLAPEYRDVKLKSSIEKKKSSLNICLCLKMVLPLSMEAKKVDKDGEEALPHCKKHSKDSVELEVCVICYLSPFR